VADRLVLGVDGGNTKTVAVVADAEGRVRGLGRSGDSNIYSTPSPEAAVEAIGAAADRALVSAGAGRAELAAAAFSLSGADWPEDVSYLEGALRKVLPATEVTVVNDAVGALWSGAPDGVGVSVVCGTGGCVAARAADGRAWHSGWWAVNTGAWALGETALQSVYAAELGLGPMTSLRDRALEVFGCASAEEVLHAFTRRGGRHPYDTALFAPAILAEAHAGDAVARGIVIDEGATLGRYAAAAARIVGIVGEPYPLVLLGGVLRDENAGLLAERITSAVPDGIPVTAGVDPVAGALRIAFRRAGSAVDHELLGEKLREIGL
jgi:N-acetylglucosamine kinase-like BadF-type ATPase